MLQTLVNANFIGNQGGGFEPQRVNAIIMAIANTSQNNFDELQLSFTRFDIPTPLGDSSVVAVQRGLTAKHFAGNVSYSGLSVDYEDYVDQATAEILLNWRQQVYNPQTKQLGPASQYKRNAQVLFTSPGGLILRKLNILGMFPLSVKIGPQADTQTDGLSMINCQFQYDECTPGDGFSTTNWAQLAGSQIAVGGFLTGSAGLGLSATVQAGVSGTAGTGFNA